jgi:hypothetical protein
MNKNFSKIKENGIETIVVFFNKKQETAKAETENAKTEFEEYKNEFYEMIVGSISSIKQHCENILNNLDKESVKENLVEPFLQQQIAIAEDYVLTTHNFVMFNEKEEEDMEAEAAKRGLWENIKRKKERLGKNYKPAKPGDKDRPSQKAWEKAQK